MSEMVNKVIWFDDWLGTRKLIDETVELGPQYLGISRQALVSEAYEKWRMKNEKSR